MKMLPDVFVTIKVDRFHQLQDGNVVFNDSQGPLLLVTIVRGVTEVLHLRLELELFPGRQIVFTCRQNVRKFQIILNDTKTGNHRIVYAVCSNFDGKTLTSPATTIHKNPERKIEPLNVEYL